MLIHSISRLRQHGFCVHTIDRNPDAPGFPLADGSAAVDITDVEGIIRYSREIGADLILPVSDIGVLPAVLASEQLGLPHLPVEVAHRCLDKGLMRDGWHQAGVPQPRYGVAESVHDVTEMISHLGCPVVVKPTINSSARGVSVVHDRDQVPAAIGFAQQHSRSGRYIVEEFVRGTEVTIEGLVQNGRPQVLTVADKELQPHDLYRVTTSINYPGRVSPSLLSAAKVMAEQAVVALGMTNAAFHFEAIANGDDVFPIELHARGGGSHIFGQIVEAVTGICMPAALVKILLGETVDICPRHQRGACYRFFSPPPGVFRGVSGIDEASRLPGVLDLGFDLRLGTKVGTLTCGPERPGYVVATGDTRSAAVAAADQAISHLRFDVEGTGVRPLASA